jgi:glycosyltransferase involved in cell wall biosynthesis
METGMNKEDIVLLSTADWDNPFWTNKQHMAVEFAARGHRVFYIDSLGLRRPSASRQDLGRIVRRLRRGLQTPRQVRPNLWVWSPVLLPLHSLPSVRWLNRLLLQLGLGYWLHRLGLRRDWLWTYNPMTAQLLDTQTYGQVIYHCVDEIKAQPGMPVTALEQAERALVEQADVVFTTAPKLYASRKPWNSRTYYFPNVADFGHFSQALDAACVVPEDLARLSGPKLGFIGAISGYKVDFALLRELALQRPDWNIVLIGKIGEGEPMTDTKLLAGLPNLHLFGARPYASLPNYLRGFDVALLPSTVNEYTGSMFPMKFFEYLAAGKPVVSTDLPALAEYASVCALAQTPAEFSARIVDALAGRCADLADRLGLARMHTYASRMDRMLLHIGSEAKS